MKEARALWAGRGVLFLVLGFSLFLRLTALDVFATADEALWYQRSLNFAQALREQHWAETLQATHPGVLTLWIGALGSVLRLLPPSSWAGPGLRQLLNAPLPATGTGLFLLTIWARTLIAFMSWLGIAAAYPLIRRLFDRRVALLGTVLLALDPFFLAHSRFHHLDALLTTFVMLSLLLLLVYTLRERRLWYLIASGVAAGLAIANKSPGVLLVPCAVLVLLLAPLIGRWPERRRELLGSVKALVLWGAVAGVVVVAVWPALWVNPVETVRRVLAAAQFYAENPHEASNYFWFAVRPDPGPFFYPVAWAYRTTPWVMLGLLAWAALRRQRSAGDAAGWLLLCAIVYAVAMTIGQKKFDRYLLPVFPLLGVIAAAGWVALLERWQPLRRWITPALAGALFLGQCVLLWPTRPYYLTYYNPVLGGGRTAPGPLLIGWGEGLDRAAAYLNSKPDAARLVVSSWHRMEAAYFFQGTTLQTLPGQPLAEPDYYETISKDIIDRTCGTRAVHKRA